MSFTNVPADLRGLPQWVIYGRPGTEPGSRPWKTPYRPQFPDMRAAANQPRTWSGFDQAVDAHNRAGFAGIGFVFAAGGGLVGVDLDNCIQDGQLDPGAAAWVERFNSYTEVSPSGKGLHIFCRGELPGKGVKRPLAEMYDRGRYFTITGDSYGPPRPLQPAQEAIDALYAELTARRDTDAGEAGETPTEGERTPVGLSDGELLEKAMTASGGEAFLALWEGDITGYPSQSEADQALCNRLAYWTNGDRERIDRLFRQSGLMREKWDRATGGSTYGDLTIDSAIRSMRQGYDPASYYQTAARWDFALVLDDAVSTFTAQELMEAELGETQYLVVELLPQGLGLLTSPPKYGKSWLVLDLCLAVTQGASFLGHETHACGCLYLALEDSPRRLKSRMKKLLAGRPAPAGLVFKTTAPDLSNGLLDILERHMEEYPDTGLIAIDTLQMVRGQADKTESAYQYDYREMRTLKAFADRHGVLLLLVHHLRKAGDDTDPHNRISGTNGILGAADTSLVLTKARKADATATLSVTGRDVESSDTVVEFDKDSCRWKPLGALEWVREQEALQEYQESPIVKTIKALLEQNGGKWRGSMSDLMEAGRDIAGVNLAESPRSLTGKVKDLESRLFEHDGIAHTRPKNGNSGGGPHIFYSCTVDAHTPEKQ